MTIENFEKQLAALKEKHCRLVTAKNQPDENWYNGIFDRYKEPVLTHNHIPLEWRFDMNYASNPNLLERIGVNAVFNSGAIYHNGKFVLVPRVEGYDRKSYFAVCESDNGIDNFKFRKYPVRLPIYGEEDTNVYDMRLTKHEDGWIYGLFCSERKDKSVNDTSTAEAKCGIVRTKDLDNWERLPDLDSKYQQRNVLLHPEFVDGKYMLYTRPSDGFIDVGSGGGIGCAFVEDMTNPVIGEDLIIEERKYHTIKETKNGGGAVPIKTGEGWLHFAHGVRNTAAGLRYVLYCFMTALDDPTRVIYAPGGYFIAPRGGERVGDVSNVVFCNGAIEKDGKIYIYYASGDTRLHLAVSTVEKMVDYCKNTPADGFTTHKSVQAICDLIDRNQGAKMNNTKIENWIDSIKDGISDRDLDLIRRAAYTFDANVIREPGDYPWAPYICVTPGNHSVLSKGLWNWDSAFHAEGLSNWDCDLAKQSIYGFFKFQDERGMLPDVVWNGGSIEDQITKPPVFAQAVKKVYQKSGDIDFVDEMYPKLCKNAEFWENYRCYEGLFYYDAFSKGKPNYITDARNESGWDNAVRWDLPVYEQWAIDLNCFMHDFYKALSFFAEELGNADEAKDWNSRADKLAKLINEKLWDDEQKCYVDTNRYTGEKSTVLTPASFMPLYSGIAPQDRAEFMNILATDENKFYSGMPTVAYDNPEYLTGHGYWRGPTWLNVAYFAAKGLKNYGFAVADEIKATILDWCAKNDGGIYENYDSTTGTGMCNNRFSWSCVFIIEFILNF